MRVVFSLIVFAICFDPETGWYYLKFPWSRWPVRLDGEAIIQSLL